MNQIFKLLLSTAVLIFATCQRAEAAVEFYDRLSFWESPVQALMPQSPISAIAAKTRAHVRVVRDDQGRITEFSYRLGDELKDMEGFSGNLYMHAPMTRVEYVGSTETHTFFNRLGRQIEVDGLFKSTYQLDKYGRYERLSFENARGDRTTNAWGAHEYRWQYPADGSVIEQRFDSNGTALAHRPRFEFERIRMVFDQRGYLSLMQNIDASGALVNSKSGAAQYRYFYDRAGRFVRWEIFDAAGRPALGPTRTAGEENRYSGNTLESISFFGPDAKPVLHDSGAARWNLQDDEFGNTIRVSYSGLDGKPVLNVYGVGQRHYVYSDDGLFLTGTSYRGLDGELMIEPEFGFSMTRLTRDARHLIAKLEYLDTEGKLVNRRDTGVAYELYSYDERGVRTGTQRFDASAQLIRTE